MFRRPRQVSKHVNGLMGTTKTGMLQGAVDSVPANQSFTERQVLCLQNFLYFKDIKTFSMISHSLKKVVAN